jgi:hypothetical protein
MQVRELHAYHQEFNLGNGAGRRAAGPRRAACERIPPGRASIANGTLRRMFTTR